VPGEDGCGKELDDWLKLVANVKSEPAPLPIPAPVVPPAPPPKEKPPMTLDPMPQACSVVLANGNPQLLRDIAAATTAAKTAEQSAHMAPHASAKPEAGASAAAAPNPQTKFDLQPAAKAHAAEKKTATQ
jgi:penicillin-insensitive murein endopeptidase